MSDDKKAGRVQGRIMKSEVFQIEGEAESYARRVTTYNEAALVSTGLDKIEADPDRKRGKANAELLRDNSRIANNDSHAAAKARYRSFLLLDADLERRQPELSPSERREILATKLKVKSETLKKYSQRYKK